MRRINAVTGDNNDLLRSRRVNSRYELVQRPCYVSGGKQSTILLPFQFSFIRRNIAKGRAKGRKGMVVDDLLPARIFFFLSFFFFSRSRSHRLNRRENYITRTFAPAYILRLTRQHGQRLWIRLKWEFQKRSSMLPEWFDRVEFRSGLRTLGEFFGIRASNASSGNVFGKCNSNTICMRMDRVMNIFVVFE